MTTCDPTLRWLLDRVHASRCYVRLILPETVDQIAQWNRSCPDWDDHMALSALRKSEELGLIQFELQAREGAPFHDVARPTLDRDVLTADVPDGPQLSYRMTAKGAAAWEAAAKPDWSLAYALLVDDAREVQEGVCECVITACSEKIVRRALIVTACDHNMLFVPGTERYHSCDAWKPTYWKSLDSGVQGAVTAAVDLPHPHFTMESLLPVSIARYYGESSKILEEWYMPAEAPGWRTIAGKAP